MATVCNMQYFRDIPEMDAEHCHLIEMIHRLDPVKGRTDALQTAWTIVNKLGDDVATHFNHEESLMARLHADPAR